MASAGALVQIGAVGAQDQFLTKDPQVTFFKGGYRRHTAFAQAHLAVQPTGGVATLGNTVQFRIPRNGDLIGRIWLECDLTPIRTSAALALIYALGTMGHQFHWSDAIGHAMITDATFRIGGHDFSTLTGDIMQIVEETHTKAGKELGKFIGHASVKEQMKAGLIDPAIQSAKDALLTVWASEGMPLWVPFPFWFVRPELHVPMIALQYHEVELSLTLRAYANLWFEGALAAAGTTFSAAQVAYAALTGAADTIQNVQLQVLYVFLDAPERRLFASQPHEFLIEEWQRSVAFTHVAGIAQENLELNFNHPVKELFWVCSRNAVTTAAAATAQPGAFVVPWNVAQGNQWINYSGPPQQWIIAHGNTLIAGATATGTVRREVDPFLTAQITVNGHVRTQAHDALYYRRIVPYESHSACPEGFIYGYSFALEPESWKPTGSFNLSRIDDTRLLLTLGTVAAAADNAALDPVYITDWVGRILVFAKNYNVMKVVSGMAGKVYAS